MIELKRVDCDNIWALVKLEVETWQQTFVATNTQSLLQAYISVTEGQIALPFGIFNEGNPVGFLMFGYGSQGDEGEPEIAKGNYCLWRLMIDKHEQGKGYGKAAMQAAIDYVRTKPCGHAEYLWTSYEKENMHAAALYASMGFCENGEYCDGETVAALKL